MARVEALEFTTVAPGGFGDLACIIKLPDARLPRLELGLFSRVTLRDGVFTCFAGEWSNPTLVVDGAPPIISDALGHGSVNWSDVGRTALAAGVAAALLALIKYCKAYGDPPLSATPSQP